MFHFIYRTIKDSKLTIIIYLAITMLFNWMFVSIFPSFEKTADDFAKVLESYPPAIMKAFGVEDAGGIFKSIEAFISVENFSFMWQILAVGLIVSLGSWAIAGLIEKKTIGLLLSYPLSRIKLFLSRYFSAISIIIVFCFVSVYSIIFFAKVYNIDYQGTNYFNMFLATTLFCWAFYAITIFLSSLFSDKGKVVFFSTGIAVFMYAINIISQLKENLDKLKYFSFFYYLDANKILAENIIPDDMYLVFIGIALIFSLIALLIFTKRDISV